MSTSKNRIIGVLVEPDADLVRRIAAKVVTALGGVNVTSGITKGQRIGSVWFETDDRWHDLNELEIDDGNVSDPFCSWTEHEGVRYYQFDFTGWLTSLRLKSCRVYDFGEGVIHDLTKPSKKPAPIKHRIMQYESKPN